MTNISLKVAPTDRTINIQCHAVNQEVADTKVESHSVSVLCEYHNIPSSVIRQAGSALSAASCQASAALSAACCGTPVSASVSASVSAEI